VISNGNNNKIGNLESNPPDPDAPEFDPTMNLLTELPSEMKQLLIEVAPNFDENLKRAFRNEAVRLQRKQNTNRHVHHLDDVLMSVDDTKM
jgi:hypothetical protein